MNGRAVVRAVGPAVAIVALQQVVFPAPAGVVARGVVVGLLAALVALGIALIQRSHGILNFAQADLGAVPAVLTVLLVVESGLPWGVAVGAGAAVAIGLGVVVERGVMRRFDGASRLVATVVTIGLAQLLTAIAGLVPRLWGERFVTDRLPPPFEASVTIDPIVFDANSILAVIVAPAAIAAVALVLARTRAGLGVRAAADDSARAATLGVDVGRLRAGVWAAAALLAFVATVLRAGILGLPIGSALTLGVLLRALAAVVVGGPSLPGIALTGVAIGVLEQGVGWGDWRFVPTPADPTSPLLLDPILAVVVLVAIAVRRRPVGRRHGDLDDGLIDADAAAEHTWPRWAVLGALAVALVLTAPARRRHVAARLSGADLRGARPVDRRAHGLDRPGFARPGCVLRRSAPRSPPRSPATPAWTSPSGWQRPPPPAPPPRCSSAYPSPAFVV